MAKRTDFKGALKGELKQEVSSNVDKVQGECEVIGEKVFSIAPKKIDKKPTRKSFPLYMDAEKLKELDKICNRTGYNRNELINKMIEFCVDNLEINSGI